MPARKVVDYVESLTLRTTNKNYQRKQNRWIDASAESAHVAILSAQKSLTGALSLSLVKTSYPHGINGLTVRLVYRDSIRF